MDNPLLQIKAVWAKHNRFQKMLLELWLDIKLPKAPPLFAPPPWV